MLFPDAEADVGEQRDGRIARQQPNEQEQPADELRDAGEHREQKLWMKTEGGVFVRGGFETAWTSARTRPRAKENVRAVRGEDYGKDSPKYRKPSP